MVQSSPDRARSTILLQLETKLLKKLAILTLRATKAEGVAFFRPSLLLQIDTLVLVPCDGGADLLRRFAHLGLLIRVEAFLRAR